MNTDAQEFEPHEFKPDEMVLVVVPYSEAQIAAGPLNPGRRAQLLEEIMAEDPDLELFIHSIYECMKRFGLNGEVMNEDTILLFGDETALVKASFELDIAFQTILCDYKTYCAYSQKADDIDPMEAFDGPRLYH